MENKNQKVLNKEDVTEKKNEDKYTSERSDAYKKIDSKLDELEEAMNKVVKSSRLRGFLEGALLTAGVIGVGAVAYQVFKK